MVDYGRLFIINLQVNDESEQMNIRHGLLGRRGGLERLIRSHNAPVLYNQGWRMESQWGFSWFQDVNTSASSVTRYR
ncbi:MAG: hypothetical protein HQL54_14315 [Magnetococcales bacterium]|nr:hypothetical protein [Magnetococcales bacterium]